MHKNKPPGVEQVAAAPTIGPPRIPETLGALRLPGGTGNIACRISRTRRNTEVSG
jgi:hypothetical protein